MRLDRFISQSTDLSRKETREAMRRGEVQVDGEVVRTADLAVGEHNKVTLFGLPVCPPGNRYLMLHKPLNVVCSTSDPRHATVISLLIDVPRAQSLHPVGRLDLDATGLVLLTDDGQWSHGITSPKRHKAKIYHVTLAEPLAEEAEKRFEKGMMLQGETKRTLPAQLERIGPMEARVTLKEGRYHQVKRMFAALGNRVVSLHREAIGGVALDLALAPGEYRPLSHEEIKALL